jgi:hypothetical protein
MMTGLHRASEGQGPSVVVAAPAQRAGATGASPWGSRAGLYARYNRWLSSIVSPRTPAQRTAGARRVVLLIAAMALMGLVDLAMTMTYMRSTGMFELNPIARALASLGAGEHLVIFKLVTISISATALYLGRHSRRGELAAWACATVLVVLMFHWADYAREATTMTNELFMLAESGEDLRSEAWVRIVTQ